MEQARKCSTFVEKRRDELKLRYKCPKRNCVCLLNKCTDYSGCSFAAKRNYQRWYDAYNQGNKELLTQIMKGAK